MTKFGFAIVQGLTEALDHARGEKVAVVVRKVAVTKEARPRGRKSRRPLAR